MMANKIALIGMLSILVAETAFARGAWFVSKNYDVPNSLAEQIKMPPSEYPAKDLIWDPIHQGVLFCFTSRLVYYDYYVPSDQINPSDWQIYRSADFGKTWKPFVLPNVNLWDPARGGFFFDDEGNLIVTTVPQKGHVDVLAWIWDKPGGEPKSMTFKGKVPFEKTNGRWVAYGTDNMGDATSDRYESINGVDWVTSKTPKNILGLCRPTAEVVKKTQEVIKDADEQGFRNVYRAKMISPAQFAMTILGQNEAGTYYTLRLSSDSGKGWQNKESSKLVEGECSNNGFYVMSRQEIVRWNAGKEQTMLDINTFDNIEVLFKQLSEEAESRHEEITNFYFEDAYVPYRNSKTIFIKLSVDPSC